MKRLELSRQDIFDIYAAGVIRGIDESSAFNCGSRCSSPYYDELIDSLCSIKNWDWNEAKAFVDSE